MVNKIINLLIVILVLFIALVHSHILDFFWLKSFSSNLYINWNYEFFKVLFFNIFSWAIIFLFFINSLLKTKEILIPKYIFLIILVLISSNLSSFTPYTSLLGNNEKWHSTFMFINVLWLIVVFVNIIKDNKYIKKILLKTIILSSFIVSIIWTKEFLIPSFDYGDLSNRAISTFGHPNYLSLFLILTIPIINNFLKEVKTKIEKNIYLLISVSIILCLILTKSIWAIFLLIFYFIYIKRTTINNFLWKKLFYTTFCLSTVLWIFLVLIYYPEKLTSFISRFYIWETTFRIVISDWKIFLFWNWLWNLDLIFEWYKNNYLYIFENFWFTADRPHNLFLYIFYSFWILWLIIFFHILYFFCKNINNYKEKKVQIHVIVLFLLFSIFNFASIASYLIIAIMLSLLSKKNIKWKNIVLKNNILQIFFVTISLFSMFFYMIYFLEEQKKYIDKWYETKNYLLNKIKFENKEKMIFELNKNDNKKLCDNLIINSKSAENYIFCWNILYTKNKELSKKYYKLWLEKLPNLWEKDSKYYNNIFINKKDLIHRFFSKKYGSINKVLKRLWIKKELDL